MATFEYTTKVSADPRAVFNFLADVRNLPLVSPPTPAMTIVDAPARLALGSRFTVRVRRFGFSITVVSEVTWFDDGAGFTDCQVRGPFRRWHHTHTVAPGPNGTQMVDSIDFEPPTWPLGWYLTEDRLRRDLQAAFAYRAARFGEVLAAR